MQLRYAGNLYVMFDEDLSLLLATDENSRESNPNAALRVAVESGGCHATSRSPDD